MVDRVYFKMGAMFQTAQVWSKLATCSRGNAGAVICDEKFNIISTGYNGAPYGSPHCIDKGCVVIDDHCVNVIHAETNAIINARQPLKNARIFCTHFPCTSCTPKIIQSGISVILYLNDEISTYSDVHRSACRQMMKYGRVILSRCELKIAENNLVYAEVMQEWS